MTGWPDVAARRRADRPRALPPSHRGRPAARGHDSVTSRATADGDRGTGRVCALCEATCGLEIRTRGREVVGIRGDADDPFSRGFICPKGYALKELDADPDRLRTPLVRRDGRLVPATWEEAFAEVERRLAPILRDGGRDAVGVYVGNP